MTDKTLRIAIFTAVYAPFLSGISIAVHQRILWLLQKGHQVLLVHPEANSLFPDEVKSLPHNYLDELKVFPGFSSYAYPTKPLVFSKHSPEPLNYRSWNDTDLLEAFHPEIVVVEEAPQMVGFYSLFWGGYGRPVGSDYATRESIPAMVLFHTDILAYCQYYLGNLTFKLIRSIIPFFVRRFSKAYDVILFPSRNQMAKYENMVASSCEYLAFQGIDCQKFHPRNICYDPIPNDPRPTIVFVGRIAPEKNVIQLLDILPIVAAKIPDVQLVIVGSGSQEKEIEVLAQRHKSNFTLWGLSTGKELLGWFARADIFVNPSITENFCTTNFEALASGTPVVASESPSASEQIVHGQNGFLSRPNSALDFADKVITILENPSLKAKMSENARASILDYDWSNCMERFEQKLIMLVSTHPKKDIKTSRL